MSTPAKPAGSGAPAVPEAPPAAETPFWETKQLEQMSGPEWESLCDGCGLCCLVKVEEVDTGDIYLTRLACRLLDVGACRCGDYANRHASEPECIVISPENVRSITWLPQTCAYRVIAEGRPLAWWHPLVSGDPETVHRAGVSVRSWALSEKGIKPSAVARYIIGEAK